MRGASIAFILLMSLFSVSTIAEPSEGLALCDRHLAEFSEDIRPALRALLEGEGLPESGISLTSSGKDRQTILDLAVVDELVSQGAKSPAQVSSAVKGFFALSPERKLEFIALVAERIVSTVETRLDISDLASVARTARSYGLGEDEYLKFLHYWNRNYQSDPTLTELRFAVLVHLSHDVGSTAKRIARYRSWGMRFQHWRQGRKVGSRGKTYAVLSLESRKRGENWLRGVEANYVEALPEAGRDLLVRRNVMSFSREDLRWLLDKFSSSLHEQTISALRARLADVEELHQKFATLMEIQKRIRENTGKVAELTTILELGVEEVAEGGGKSLSGTEWSAIEGSLDLLNRNTDWSKTKEQLDEILEKTKDRLASKQYMHIFERIMSFAYRISNASVALELIDTLFTASSQIELNSTQLKTISEQVKGYSYRYPHDMAQVIMNRAFYTWGKKPTPLKDDRRQEIESSLAQLRGSLQKDAQEEAALLEIIKTFK
jgi:hypothetical protein